MGLVLRVNVPGDILAGEEVDLFKGEETFR